MLTLKRRKPGGNYTIRGTFKGQSVYESTGTSNRAAAEIIKARREQEILERSTLGKAATLTFAEAALTYMETGGENRFIERILLHAGPETLLTEIDNQWINDAAAAIYPAAANATVNRQLITPISAIYNLATEEGLAPYRRFRRRKTPKTGKRWLTPEEAEALISHADPHLLPILGCLLGTGARTSEALGAEAHFYYPATGEIYLPDVKNEHPRMLRMPQRALEMIETAEPPTVGRIFLTPKGRPYVLRENGGGQIQAAFNKARDAAGLEARGPRKVTPHTCRHTWATWYYAATKDFGGLIDLGGWEKSDMANHYRKNAPDDLAQRLLAHGWNFQILGTGLQETAPKTARMRTVK